MISHVKKSNYTVYRFFNRASFNLQSFTLPLCEELRVISTMNLADSLVARAASLCTIYSCVSACHSLPAAATGWAFAGSKSCGAGFLSRSFPPRVHASRICRRRLRPRRTQQRVGFGALICSSDRALVASETPSSVTALSVLFISLFIYFCRNASG